MDGPERGKFEKLDVSAMVKSFGLSDLTVGVVTHTDTEQAMAFLGSVDEVTSTRISTRRATIPPALTPAFGTTKRDRGASGRNADPTVSGPCVDRGRATAT